MTNKAIKNNNKKGNIEKNETIVNKDNIKIKIEKYRKVKSKNKKK